MEKRCACIGVDKNGNWGKFGTICYNCPLKPEELPNCKPGPGELILIDDDFYIKTKAIAEE